MPFAVRPGLHPGVIVIRMRPSRSVHLPCGNAHRPEGGHKKSGLLPAPSVGSPDRCQRGACSGVRRLINRLLMTPVVDLENRLLHGKILHPWSKFPEEHRSGSVQILIVHPHRKHEMPHLPLRNGLSPRHLTESAESEPAVVEMILRRKIQHIAYRHIGIEKLHGLPLGFRHLKRIQTDPGRLEHRRSQEKVLLNRLEHFRICDQAS